MADRDQPLNAMQKALLALGELRARLKEFEAARDEPVAIVGIGCRIPGGANSPESFWRLLDGGVDAITEMPGDRWDADAFFDPELASPSKMNTRWGGFLSDIRQFDASFFQMSAREASGIDPQQRFLMEVSWEALEDAAQAPDRLAESRTGVFVGASSWDFSSLLTKPPQRGGTGVALAILANRISNFYGLNGPSLVIDTACSSSLVAVDMACHSLRSGTSDMALAGGVSLMVHPYATVSIAQAGMLARDGRCKTFDARADGYVRSEGCALVVLKRLSDALRDRNRIYALIRGSAVNHCGRTNGLTAPNGGAQARVVRQALDNSGLRPDDIDYVETHGTGTLLGDVVEIDALWSVHREGRTTPCVIGSLKTNIGHMEAAAGVGGLIKTALALHHRTIPPHLHLETPNPHLGLDDKLFEIPRTARAWMSGERIRRAGVSSFGFGGTNAHAILEEAPQPAPRADSQWPPPLLALSAASPTGLSTLAAQYRDRLAKPGAAIADLAFSSLTGRASLRYRAAIPLTSAKGLTEQLDTLAANPPAALPKASIEPKLAMGFHAGSPSREALQPLLDHEPVFREAVAAIGAGLGHADADATIAGVDDATCGFVAGYALGRLWQSWGAIPAGCIGEGAGLLTAAALAGAIDPVEAARLVRTARFERVAWRRPVTALIGSGGPPIEDRAQFCAALAKPHGAPVALPRDENWVVLDFPATDVDRGCRRASALDLAAAAAALFEAGVPVDWRAYHAQGEHASAALPTYPFERRYHWPPADEIRSAASLLPDLR